MCDRTALARLHGMSASTPLQLPPEDKLDVLRYLDEFHYWHSLDDERRCGRCGSIITGRQILVIELQGTRGKLRLQCPTAGCVSTPGAWAYANPLQAAKLRSDVRPVAPGSEAGAISAERAHHGEAGAVHRLKRPGTKTAAASRTPKRRATGAAPVSFRAVVARLALLRPVATALHAFQPIA